LADISGYKYKNRQKIAIFLGKTGFFPEKNRIFSGLASSNLEKSSRNEIRTPKNLYLDTLLKKSGIRKNPEKNPDFFRKNPDFSSVAAEDYQEASPPKI